MRQSPLAWLGGQFLDVNRAVRVGLDASFRIRASELQQAVDRIIALRNDVGSSVVVCKTNGSSIDLRSDRRGKNSGNETVDAEIGGETEFGFGASQVSSLLKLWPKGALLDIAAPDATSPIHITSADLPEQVQVVMPMRG